MGLGSLLIGGLATGFQAIPWNKIATSPLLMFLGSAGIISVQVWLATRYKAFAVSTGVALFGAIAGGLISNSATYWYYFPWTYPAFGLNDTKNTWAIGLSFAVALLTLIAATRDFQKRDML
jgi:hypothetical protein